MLGSVRRREGGVGEREDLGVDVALDVDEADVRAVALELEAFDLDVDADGALADLAVGQATDRIIRMADGIVADQGVLAVA